MGSFCFMSVFLGLCYLYIIIYILWVTEEWSTVAHKTLKIYNKVWQNKKNIFSFTGMNCRQLSWMPVMFKTITLYLVVMRTRFCCLKLPKADVRWTWCETNTCKRKIKLWGAKSTRYIQKSKQLGFKINFFKIHTYVACMLTSCQCITNYL